MSHSYSPIQIYNLLKACMIFLIVQAGIVILFFYSVLISQTFYRPFVLLINIVISGVLGWRLYKQRYHMVFSYDEKGFRLKQGSKEEIDHKWSEFSKVSLVRTEQGDFSIRLLDSGDPFDLPASRLRLDPFAFRWEVTRLVEGSRKNMGR